MSKNAYKLLPNEAIILKQDSILYGGRMANFSDELILTNLNIVLTNKGLFGNFKSMTVFPIKKIRKYQNKAQVMLSKTSGGYPQIEVYFQNGEEKFGFQSKNIANHWIETIDKLVNEESVEIGSAPKPEIPGLGVITDALGSTFGKFKETFGSKNNQEQKVESINHTGKCSFCGAPLTKKTGLKRCVYCDSEQ